MPEIRQFVRAVMAGVAVVVAGVAEVDSLGSSFIADKQPSQL